MTVTASTFRSDFPEFGTSPGSGAFTDTRIDFWLTVSANMIDQTAWGVLADHGTELFIAHHLTMDDANQKAQTTGGAIGRVTGPVASQGVGGASISYSDKATLDGEAGHWNLSTYGIQFRQLQRMVGAGGVQL